MICLIVVISYLSATTTNFAMNTIVCALLFGDTRWSSINPSVHEFNDGAQSLFFVVKEFQAGSS